MKLITGIIKPFRLDAVLLHTVLFGSLLGLTEESQEKKANLEFEQMLTPNWSIVALGHEWTE